MSVDAQTKLAASCSDIAELSGQAFAWIEDGENSAVIGAETRSLVQVMRKSQRRARRLARAATTRMSVSVFGPSQAGKSFLVSVLARPETGPLIVDFDGPNGQLDYIREINPEGEGESTGLVTRFTMERQPSPDGYPIRLTLLSEADLVRTLVNSFFMDGDRSEQVPSPTDLAAHLDQFKARSGPTQPGIDADEIHEVGDYIENLFGREAYAAALKPLWDEAAECVPGLSLADRAAFFSVLWGGHTPFSDLYLKLGGALAQLGHSETVHVGLDALIPRETSIIDVKTLSGVGDAAPLPVLTEAGARVLLPRSVVCGLAAELVLPMRDLPSALFTETDLLDFPGARNRFEQDLSKAFANADSILPELLLRGKVAYLFDRYVQNQEITSMLLCIPDSNMETVDLPGLVQTWIASTHGSTPEQRAGVDPVLFMVLTKFDKHLSDSAAEGGDETRFERRMQASLLEKFGKGNDPWVRDWQPGQPFSNCFWLRNPNFYVDGLLEYGPNKVETGIRPDKVARIDELRRGCLQAPSVQTHFADSQAAWEAALSLNDGGVGYLLQNLKAVCRPDRKLEQIKAQLEQLRAGLQQAISPFHVSDDVEVRISEKQEAAGRVIDDLEQVFSRHRFGALMAALMVDQEEIEGRISRVPSTVRITNAVQAATETTPRSTGLQRPGRSTRPETNSVPAASEIRTMSLAEFQAETALSIWIDTIKSFREDSARRGAYGLGDAAAQDLISELIHAARRTKLSQRTAVQLEVVNFGLTVEKQAQPASILGAEAINNFVSTLGMLEVPESQRPKIELADGEHRLIFAAAETSDNADDLPAQPSPVGERVWTDWVFGLDALFVANAKEGLGGQVNIDQNLRLGRILTALNGSS